jgi:hypothetical protein
MGLFNRLVDWQGETEIISRDNQVFHALSAR